MKKPPDEKTHRSKPTDQSPQIKAHRSKPTDQSSQMKKPQLSKPTNIKTHSYQNPQISKPTDEKTHRKKSRYEKRSPFSCVAHSAA
jgi:hypothetical protein